MKMDGNLAMANQLEFNENNPQFNNTKMKRDLKFRCWNTVILCWIDKVETAITLSGNVIRMRPDRYFNAVNEDENILMQFTGLKDKNGKEVWEGDILKVHIFTQELGESLGVREGEKEFIAEICYQELGLWLQGDTEEEGGYILWFNGMHEESLEVIGNIFENPELLNTGG